MVGMTLANQITIGRIVLIPVVVLFCVYYGQGVESGNPQEWQRLAAIGVFVLAALSDGLDGYFARHRNQRSHLGAVLDPIADKGLLLTAILTLSLGSWNHAFPLWFPVLVIARDAVILTGCGVLYLLNQKLDVKPSWTGKAATAAQMIAITWVMLQLPHYLVSVYLAGILTLLSGIDYLARGILSLRPHDHTH
jgi:CDP-diacylglycerol--glycerol-3-phosphate 3-phosphatidyltransferase